MLINKHGFKSADYYSVPGVGYSFTIAFKCSVDDDSGKYHLLEHLIACGFNKKYGANIYQTLRESPLVEYLNAFTKSNYIGFTCVSQNLVYLEKTIDILFEIIFNFNFNDHDFNREKRRIFLEIVSGGSSSHNQYWNKIKKNIFTDTNHKFNSGGVPDYLFNTTRGLLIKIYKDNIKISNATIFATGNPRNISSLLSFYGSTNTSFEYDTTRYSTINDTNLVSKIRGLHKNNPINENDIFVYSVIFKVSKSFKEKIYSIFYAQIIQVILLSSVKDIFGTCCWGESFSGVEDSYINISSHLSFKVSISVSSYEEIKKNIDSVMVSVLPPKNILKCLLNKIFIFFVNGRYKGLPKELQMHNELLSMKYQNIDVLEYNDINEIFNEIDNDIERGIDLSLLNEFVNFSKITKLTDNKVQGISFDDLINKNSKMIVSKKKLCRNVYPEAYSLYSLKLIIMLADQRLPCKKESELYLENDHPLMQAYSYYFHPCINNILMIFSLEEKISEMGVVDSCNKIIINCDSVRTCIRLQWVSRFTFLYVFDVFIKYTNIRFKAFDLKNLLEKMIQSSSNIEFSNLVNSAISKRNKAYNDTVTMIDSDKTIINNEFKLNYAFLLGGSYFFDQATIDYTLKQLSSNRIISCYFLQMMADDFENGFISSDRIPSKITKSIIDYEQFTLSNKSNDTIIIKYNPKVLTKKQVGLAYLTVYLLRLEVIKNIIDTSTAYTVKVTYTHDNNEFIILVYSAIENGCVHQHVMNSFSEIASMNFDLIEIEFSKLCAINDCLGLMNKNLLKIFSTSDDVRETIININSISVANFVATNFIFVPDYP